MKREQVKVRIIKQGNARRVTLFTAKILIKKGWRVEDPSYDENLQPKQSVAPKVEASQKPVEKVEASSEIDSKVLGSINRTKRIPKLQERLEKETNEEIREAITNRIKELENE